MVVGGLDSVELNELPDSVPEGSTSGEMLASYFTIPEVKVRTGSGQVSGLATLVLHHLPSCETRPVVGTLNVVP